MPKPKSKNTNRSPRLLKVVQTPTVPQKVCKTCGAPNPPGRKLFCCDKCRRAEDAKRKAAAREYCKGVRMKAEKYKPSKPKAFITDEEQVQLNISIDAKQNLTFEYKQYTPAEIAAIAHKITPPHLIRGEVTRTGIYAPVDTESITYGRRRESATELR